MCPRSPLEEPRTNRIPSSKSKGHVQLFLLFLSHLGSFGMGKLCFLHAFCSVFNEIVRSAQLLSQRCQTFPCHDALCIGMAQLCTWWAPLKMASKFRAFGRVPLAPLPGPECTRIAGAWGEWRAHTANAWRRAIASALQCCNGCLGMLLVLALRWQRPRRDFKDATLQPLQCGSATSDHHCYSIHDVHYPSALRYHLCRSESLRVATEILITKQASNF